MKRLLTSIILLMSLSFIISCSTSQVSEDDVALDAGTDSSSGETNEFGEFEEPDNNQQENKKEEVAQENPPPQEAAPETPPMEEPPPAQIAESINASEKPIEITDLKFKANDSGGTLIVEATGPMTFTTRKNTESLQFVVEIPNSILPDRLKRSLNTKDMEGLIGAVDAYQNSGSNVSRIVLQLRPGSQDPAVQVEGKSLLIVADGTKTELASSPSATVDDVNVDLDDSKILTSQSLQEYLSGNTKFYGKKISIEVNNMEVKEALKFIMEESGVNMVISDEIKGTVSLKLRQIPWDQALVVIMRAKRLGYARQGNVLRITSIDQLKSEEEEANQLAKDKKVVEPLKVRVFPITYARVDELEKKLKDFLTPDRGKAVGDPRTSSLIVTDIDEALTRIAKLIETLDIQPPQVMIEGKIVEASEEFIRGVGINWGFDGESVLLTKTGKGPLNLSPTLRLAPSVTSGAGNLGNPFNLNLTLGRMDFFGNLDATLLLNERDNKVKIISSPRVVTLTNEAARISQVTQVPVRKITTSATTSTVTFDFKDLSLLLDVTPQVTGDSSIIMKVKVTREIQGASVDVTNEAFSVDKREADTKVLVRNGETSVIAGVYQSDVAEGATGVPFLKDIPFLGRLFKSTTTTKRKNELLIFLTPRILNPIESSRTAKAGEI